MDLFHASIGLIGSLVFFAGGGILAICVVFAVINWANGLLESVSSIADSLGYLADHLEHSCDKCKAEAESEDTTNSS